jgi:D-arabinose 5-phosphate isomerase GutQ
MLADKNAEVEVFSPNSSLKLLSEIDVPINAD